MHNNSHTETNKAILAFCDRLLRPSEDVEWLMRAGPIAARLNAESRAENEAHNREAGSAEEAPATHHGD